MHAGSLIEAPCPRLSLMRFSLPRALFALAAPAIAHCGAAAPPTTSAASTLPSAMQGSTLAIDTSRCNEDSARLRPFAINWDPTEQAEFGRHMTASIVVVRIKGCSLELLEQCSVPGEYRFTETSGNLEELTLGSQEDVYAHLPLSVVSLSAQVAREGSLTMRYFVRGIGYATTPVV